MTPLQHNKGSDECDVKCGEIYLDVSKGSLTFSCSHCTVKYSKLDEFAIHLQEVYQLINLSPSIEKIKEELTDNEDGTYETETGFSTKCKSFEIEFMVDSVVDSNTSTTLSNVQSDLIEDYDIFETVQVNHTNVQDASIESVSSEESVYSSEQEITKKILKQYACSLCNVTFSEKNKLTKHSNMCHSKSFGCDICGKYKFSRFPLFKKHILEVHQLNSIKCSTCEESVQLTEFARHRRRHTDQFHCIHCNDTFNESCKLDTHLRLYHTASKKYLCTICNKYTYKKWEFLKKHVLKIHQSDRINCATCKESVKLIDFVKHRQSHDKTKCKICGKLMFGGSFVMHAKSHLVKPENQKTTYQCYLCGELPSSKERLTYHMRVKHPNVADKKFECNICDKAYAFQAALDDHVRMHKKLRPFLCDVCHKDFTTKYYLDIHMTLHTGIRKYKCDQCDLSFRTSSHRLRHVRYVHLNNSKRYSCTICDKKYEYPQRLKFHMVSHTGDRPYQCQHCEKNYAHPRKLVRHQNKVHPELTRPFKCGHCDKRFLSASALKQHKFIAHGDDDS